MLSLKRFVTSEVDFMCDTLYPKNYCSVGSPIWHSAYNVQISVSQEQQCSSQWSGQARTVPHACTSPYIEQQAIPTILSVPITKFPLIRWRTILYIQEKLSANYLDYIWHRLRDQRKRTLQSRTFTVFPHIVAAATILFWIHKSLKISYSFLIKFSLM